ncbi:MAG: Hpt domain-containing protein [Chitinophagaceae bacterium]|nr:Hpt domain-containing protein [Chitinophagaceae bacterium]
MKDPFLHKKFIFNDNINSDFLFSLYEDDFLYIEEIFKTTLDQLGSVVAEVPVVFENKNFGELRSIIHKIKPAFGFTGLLKTEEACKQFENACMRTSNAEELATLYRPLWALVVESMDIMQRQYDQLKEFNKP